MAISHRNPFDRMLIAQAIAQGFVVASNESAFDAFGFGGSGNLRCTTKTPRFFTFDDLEELRGSASE